MDYYQIIYIFPHPNDPIIFFVPAENIPKDIDDEMWFSNNVPEGLELLSGIIYPTYKDGHYIMPNIKISKIFTFVV